MCPDPATLTITASIDTMTLIILILVIFALLTILLATGNVPPDKPTDYDEY
jgi:hypothetical protein